MQYSVVVVIIIIIIIRLIICLYFLSFAFVCITQNSKFRQVWHAVCIVKQNLHVMLRLSVYSVAGNVISTAGIVATMHLWVIAFVILQSYLLSCLFHHCYRLAHLQSDYYCCSRIKNCIFASSCLITLLLREVQRQLLNSHFAYVRSHETDICNMFYGIHIVTHVCNAGVACPIWNIHVTCCILLTNTLCTIHQ